MKQFSLMTEEEKEQQRIYNRAYRAKTERVTVTFSEKEFSAFMKKYRKALKENPKLSMGKFLKSFVL